MPDIKTDTWYVWNCSKHGDIGSTTQDIVDHRIYLHCFRVVKKIRRSNGLLVNKNEK